MDRTVPCNRVAVTKVDGRPYCNEHAQRYFQEEINARKRPADDKKALSVSST